ncbi:MAG: TIGR03960 family B12-binding radical SAM protein [Candidatus Nanopelagicales bacterium]|nr:TIGR03960 family B12-binding radical SAM protein [Candidatus Nanopelagicales bacterium]
MVDSVFGALEPLLGRVAKPVQYVGGEVNSVRKDWDAADVRWALLYLDVYEVGAPNQGIQILYEVLNSLDRVLAERAYAVWPDLEDAMRGAGVPAFTVDCHRPLAAFDVLGVSLATELGHTNLLSVLDLAGIALHAADRKPSDPLVIAGGHSAFNPEPLADFLDGVILGDGEEAVAAVTGVIRDWKLGGERGGRDGLLARLAATGGVYVPAFYDVDYLQDGPIAFIKPNRAGVPWRVSKHTLMDLDHWPYPRAPVVPVAETVHERMSVEIFRGCTRGCRFCQAGMITRPVRERSGAALARMVSCGLASTGYDEVGLLSLSSADHSEIGSLAKVLADTYTGSRVALSLPSTRVDVFNIELAGELSRNGRRSGLTFAPEGGSERLRRVINKNVTEADLMATVTAAYASGWRHVKLYFMCGLPTETDDDVRQIARLATDVIRAGRQATGRSDVRCTLSVGGFVPKPHTPFQWAAQLDYEETDRRLAMIRDQIRGQREFARAIKVKYHDGRPGVVEGLLARGDRRVGAVIEEVWRRGGRFDAWSEYFSFDRWTKAAEDVWRGTPVSLDWYTTREREHDEILPWAHLDAGLDTEWLWQEWTDALADDELGDCRWAPCSICGVCDQLGTDTQLSSPGAAHRAELSRRARQ